MKLNNFKEIMEIGKRDSKQEFKHEYVFKDGKTHLITVAKAIMKFDMLVKDIMDTSVKYYESFDKAVDKIKSKLNKDEISLVKKLIALELLDAPLLLRLVDEDVVCSDTIVKYLEPRITDKETGLEYAVAIGILDDYIEFLTGSDFNGPKTSIQ